MKKVILFLSFFIMPFFTVAQTALSDSDRFGEYIYVYKLDRDQLRSLLGTNSREITEKYLDKYQTRYRHDAAIPELPRGNYVLVQAIGNRLRYSTHTVDDLRFSLSPGDRLALCLFDSAGNSVDDAQVSVSGRRARFDRQTKTYTVSMPKGQAVVEVDNRGVYHYISLNDRTPRPYHYRPDNEEKKESDSRFLTGTMSYSKPKYKPGETVKFKAYITNRKRKPLNTPLEVRLERGRSYRESVKNDTLLTVLSPYGKGLYTYEFKLTDSLDLALDYHYALRFTEPKTKRTVHLYNNFYYEDYELGKITFTAKSDKNTYYRGEGVELSFKATDENGMAIFDGRVEIEVRNSNIEEFNGISLFMPSEVWKGELALDQPGANKIIIPASAFPAEATANYIIDCSLLSSDNEEQSSSVYITRSKESMRLEFEDRADGVRVVAMDAADTVKAARQASVVFVSVDGQNLGEEVVTLPALIAPAANVSVMTVKSGEVTGTHYLSSYHSHKFNASFYRSGDRIKLDIANPQGYPVRYMIWKGDNVIDKGYSTERKIAFSREDNGKNDYTARVDRYAGGKISSGTYTVARSKGNLTLDVNTPSVVYPGQTVSVDMTLTDYKGRAVQNADLTAYAYTSKFARNNYFQMPIWKALNSDFVKILHPYGDEKQLDKFLGRMSWDRWKSEMGLEKIEYYKFIRPDSVYSYAEPADNQITQIAPYVIVDGDVQGAQVVWIDGVPYYFHNAQQLQPYTFAITSGRHHVRIRTADRLVSFEVDVRQGMKNIVSVRGDLDMDGKHGLKIIDLDKLESNEVLVEGEYRNLMKHMIRLDRNFDVMRIKHPTISTDIIDMSAYLASGDRLYYLPPFKYRMSTFIDGNKQSKASTMLVGPFPYRLVSELYTEGKFREGYDLEGGYTYTLTPDKTKMRSMSDREMSPRLHYYTPEPDFREQVIDHDDVDSLYWESVCDLLMSEDWDIRNRMAKGAGVLYVRYGKMADSTEIKPVFIRFEGVNEPGVAYFSGSDRYFDDIPCGRYAVSFWFRDLGHVFHTVDIKKGGATYLYLDKVEPSYFPKEVMTRDIIISDLFYPIRARPELLASRLKNVKAKGAVLEENLAQKIITGRVYSSKKAPLPGALVKIYGTDKYTYTDREGRFALKPTLWEGRLVVSAPKHEAEITNLICGFDYEVMLSASPTTGMYSDSWYDNAENITIRTGGIIRDKTGFTGSYSSLSSDELKSVGRVNVLQALRGLEPSFVIIDNDFAESDPNISAKIELRGKSALVTGGGETAARPLVIVNGLPYSGNLEDIDMADVVDLKVVNGERAVPLYGEQASGGVIIIMTNESIAMTEGAAGNSLRRNFRDDAFWQPVLTTDKQGRASFETTYPDDITSWDANFMAISGKNNIALQTHNIRSFKALNAQLSLPAFAIEGDRFDGVGKVSNYLNDTISVRRETAVNGNEQTPEDITITTSYTDKIPVEVEKGDSLSVRYTIRRENGYFDGEERAIPVYRQGVSEANGVFRMIDDDSLRTFNFDAAAGAVTVRAESSSLDMFLREIQKVDEYGYLCSEQMASKVKALVMKKRICRMFEMEFTGDEKIEELLSKLDKAANKDRLWGWWGGNQTSLWISQQVVEAMLMAEKEGFKTGLDRHSLTTSLATSMPSENNFGDHWSADTKQDYCRVLLLMKQLGADINYGAYAARVVDMDGDNSVYGKLLSMRVTQIGGGTVQIDSLKSWAKTTTLGSMYWSDGNRIRPLYRFAPYRTEVQSTLLAYNILRDLGGHEETLSRIRAYFFEMRRGGSWRNTYESANILETIIPDMLKPGERYEAVKAEINGRQIDKFPYTETVQGAGSVTLRKSGTAPLFFTAYQRDWNPAPEAVDDKGFSVISSLQNGTRLTAGKQVTLEVTVEAKSSSDYVMVEVPIPAGCSYDSKSQTWWSREVHREYYKDRVSIFCSYLPEGKTTFKIELMPRFTGEYHLNPARVELMYFPTLYGRDDMKNITIK